MPDLNRMSRKVSWMISLMQFRRFSNIHNGNQELVRLLKADIENSWQGQFCKHKGCSAIIGAESGYDRNIAKKIWVYLET